MPKIRRALISVTDKTGIVDLAKVLNSIGCEILSTGGTAKALRSENIPVTDVSDYTGSPEILDGRLKTLHPKIHGGLLGMRSNEKHISEMNANKIQPIDMVIVNLYQFEQTIAKGADFHGAIENIDIGGPTMLRSAAKNYQDVSVIVDPIDYAVIVEELKSNGGSISVETNFRLMKKVFATTSRYDVAISNYLNSLSSLEKCKEKLSEVTYPETIGFTYVKAQELRYGENPHQKAAFYREYDLTEPCVANMIQHMGKELSYNNIMDTDAVVELVKEFTDDIAVAIIKHANPCGVARSGTSLEEAFKAAKECDPLSAFGGIVGLNRTVDEKTAAAMLETFFEVIVAPGYEKGALEAFRAKKNLRILELPGLDKQWHGSNFNLRKVVGGLLVQDRDLARTDVRNVKIVTKRAPTDSEFRALDFAWKVVKHVKSNAIVFTDDQRTLGIGAGQMSRVDSVNIAINKAQNKLKGSVMASDAFFPFRDSVDLAAKAGITAIVQPGGSLRDDDSVKAADEYGIAMILTGTRHFRH